MYAAAFTGEKQGDFGEAFSGETCVDFTMEISSKSDFSLTDSDCSDSPLLRHVTIRFGRRYLSKSMVLIQWRGKDGKESKG